MVIEGSFDVAAPPQALLTRLFDPGFMAACLPGCRSLERVDDNRYVTVVEIGLAGINALFDLEVEVTDRTEQSVKATTRGQEGGRASTLLAESLVTLAATPDGTRVGYRSDVTVSGRLGRFALGMMKKKAQSVGDEFAVNLRKKLEDA